MKQPYILTTALLTLCFSNAALAQTTEVVSELAYTYGILFDGDELYISNPKIDGLANSRLYKTNITEQPTTLTDIVATENLNTPYGLALNGTDLYISDYEGSKIFKIDISLENPTPELVATGIVNPIGMAISGSDLYVIGLNKILKIDLTATLPTTATEFVTGLDYALDILINGTDLYFSDLFFSQIYKIDLTADTPIATSILGVTFPTSLALKDGYLYIATNPNLNARSVHDDNAIVTFELHPLSVVAGGDQTYCPETQQNIVTPLFNITDQDDTTLEVFNIQMSSGYVNGEDQLTLTGIHPNIEATWIASQAKLTLTGPGGGDASIIDMIAAVKAVVFQSSNPNPVAKTFSLTAGSASFLPSNNHYYDFVASELITWTDAKAAAESMSYNGIQGYLATLTAADEIQLAGELSPGTGWIGANSVENEGVWNWVTGPEAGTTFWNGDDTGAAAPGMLSNWNDLEPNNLSVEQYVHITEPGLGIPGSWNNLPNDTATQVDSYQATGFVVEYGGMPGDPVLSISASTTLTPVLVSTSNFDPINAICNGDVLNPLPTTSNEGFTGTWTPALDNTITTEYTFTADAGQCADTATLTITVNQKTEPLFTAVADICDGDVLNPLPTISNDGFTGTWTPVLDNTLTTVYTFTPDAGECANPTTLTINVNQKVDPDFNIVNDVCNGAILAPLPTLSNDGFNGTWSPALDTTTTTTYTFTPDLGECANPVTSTITVNPIVDPTFDPVDDICDGSVLAPLPTISNEGINGTWSPALDATATTTYTFTPDAGECANPTTLTITYVEKINSFFTPVNDICNGDALTPLPTTSNNGVIGTWTPALDATATTTYTFTPDVGECAFPTTLNIVVNQKVNPDFTPVNDICDGDLLLPLPITSNDGITGSWSPTIDNTITTTYTFTPNTWECANPIVLTITVEQKTDPVFTPVDDICNGDVLAALPITSNNGVTGTWSPALDNTLTTFYTFTPTAGLCANPATLTIVVEQKVDPVFTAVNDICDGDILVPLPTTSNDGINGTWAPALDNTLTTLYTFTPDAGECANPATLTISVNQKVDPVFTPINDICNGEPLAPLPQTSNNGITGTWNQVPGSTATTTYTFTPDEGECANPTTLTIVVNQKVDPDFTPVNDICDGDLIMPLPMTSNDGVTGSWSPALDNTITTTYTFSPELWECANPVTLTITVEQKTNPEFTPVDDICNGDVLVPLPTTSNNGITGTWAPALDNTTTSVYTFTPDAGLCANPATLTIAVIQKVDPIFTPVDGICENDVLAPLPTTSNDGITGTWTPALDNTITTLYTFTPDVGECANTATLTILVEQRLNSVFTPVDAICDGEALTTLPTTSNNGITGTWSPILNNRLTTTYTFTPNWWECAHTEILTIEVNQKVDPDFTPVDDICDGDFLTALPTTSNEGITGNWSPILDNTQTTTYRFAPNPWECAIPTTLTIVVAQKADPVFTPVNDICDGDFLTPLPTVSNDGFSGTWSPAMDNTNTTLYTFTPTIGECANPTTLTIVVIPNSVSTFTQIDPICDGDTVVLPTLTNEGFRGSWTPAFNNNATTTYTFTADPGECAEPTTMTVVVNPINVLTISAINQSEDFDANQIISVSVTGGSGSYEYQLDGGDWQLSSVFEYVIGCEEHTIRVRDVIDICNTQPEATLTILEFPKFFTPNGDGYNDTWNIKCFLDDPFAIVRLSDRYGKLLYEFKPSQDAWNGSFNGMMLPGTDYWFVVTYINSSGVETIYKSHFSLRR